MEYEKMLERVRKLMPESVFEKERFEIPKALGHIQGNRTIISNFLQMASSLGRESDHMLKYILKELATPGEIKKSGSLIFGTKVPASRINEKIRKYVSDFVFCPECGKPDTKLQKESGITFIKCSACGAKKAVKYRI